MTEVQDDVSRHSEAKLKNLSTQRLDIFAALADVQYPKVLVRKEGLGGLITSIPGIPNAMLTFPYKGDKKKL